MGAEKKKQENERKAAEDERIKREEENKRKAEQEAKAKAEAKPKPKSKPKAKSAAQAKPSEIIAKAEKEKSQASRNKPHEFEVVLDKTRGQPLGINVATLNDGSLKIESVSPDKSSIVGAWNSGNPGNQVVAGDVIYEVNGAANDAESLITELKKNQFLACTIRRP